MTAPWRSVQDAEKANETVACRFSSIRRERAVSEDVGLSSVDLTRAEGESG